MQIRPAVEADIPSIVNLLKISLGEDLMPKSERYWRWKHIENPFGQSPVLLCYENDTLVGVRAFMRWEWRNQQRVYKALRAVDTATDPAYQGKGIFKKLTLALIDHCRDQGDDFIFNTPNSQSKPGYLKMGWEEAGKLPIAFSIQRPIGLLEHFIRRSRQKKEINQNSQIKYFLDHPDLHSLVGNYTNEQIVTNVSPAYLRWRYLVVPVANYIAMGEEKGQQLMALVVGRIKKTRIGTEFRITDCFLREDSHEKGLIHQLEECKKAFAIDYCTISGTMPKKFLRLIGGITWKLGVGPAVTVRSVNLLELSNLHNFNVWSPSLGDLELF